MAQITTRKYPVLDISLNVAEVGSGPALILIHGWCNNWLGWTPLAQILSRHFHLYMIDTPGFGDSDQLPSYTLSNIAKYIHAFISTYHLTPQAIIGASMGTQLVVQLSKNHPGIAPRIILLGTPLKHLRLATLARFYMSLLALLNHRALGQNLVAAIIKTKLVAYATEFFLNAYKFNKRHIDLYGLPGRKKITGRSYLQLGLSAYKTNIDKLLSTTALPTLLVYGNHDRYVDPISAQKFVQQSQNPLLHISLISACGHNPAYEQPHHTAQTITTFLEQPTTPPITPSTPPG